MKVTRILLAVGLLSASLAALAGAPSNPANKLYADHCAMCHGTDGKAVMPGAGDMTDPKGPLSKPDAVLIKNTLEGIGNMPGFKGQLDNDQIADIIAYMRKEFGVKAKH
jgi:mono/diheme cytochrome c family protein